MRGIASIDLWRVGRIVVWTALLVGTVVALDRFLFPATPPGWHRANSLAGAPNNLVDRLVPSYLPEALQWPPKVVLTQSDPTPGLWLGVSRKESNAVVLWLGLGEPPPPELMGKASGCLRPRGGSACPNDWHSLSTLIEPSTGEILYLLTSLEPVHAHRVLEGFRRMGQPDTP